MKWLKSHQIFEYNKNGSVKLLPSREELLQLIKDKIACPEIMDFYKKYLISDVKFITPKIEGLKTSATITFYSKTKNTTPAGYIQNPYGIARFINDFQLRKLGASPVLPYENEDEDGKQYYEIGYPEILFEVRIYEGAGRLDDLLQIRTEYFVQYMNHSMDYGDKYNKNDRKLTKKDIWIFINEILDKFVSNIKEYHKQFERGYTEKGSLIDYYLDVLKKYISVNKYGIVGRISEYTETLKLLGISTNQATDAANIDEMGFTD